MHTISFSHTIFMLIPIPDQKAGSCALPALTIQVVLCFKTRQFLSISMPKNLLFNQITCTYPETLQSAVFGNLIIKTTSSLHDTKSSERCHIILQLVMYNMHLGTYTKLISAPAVSGWTYGGLKTRYSI